MKDLLIQLRDALVTADQINRDREGVDGPDGYDANGKAADHILTPEFRNEWRQIREAAAAASKVLNDIEADERLDDAEMYRDDGLNAVARFFQDEPDNARNLGLGNEGRII